MRADALDFKTSVIQNSAYYQVHLPADIIQASSERNVQSPIEMDFKWCLLQPMSNDLHVELFLETYTDKEFKWSSLHM